ncbi:hypothetical protein ACW9HJ_20265 [Nocardia gipuzkoensis]
MITVTRPPTRGLLRLARAMATVALTLLITSGATACSATTPQVAPYAAVTQGDPAFEEISGTSSPMSTVSVCTM